MNDRIQNIINNKRYREYVENIKCYEKNRRFCKHNLEHFIDVARIGLILAMKERLAIKEELLYAAALLHDIGRHIQYEDGSDHALVSAGLALPILEKSGFFKEEISDIIKAIENHRNENVSHLKDLSGILYRADKLSRACYFCEVQSECDWKKDKKNLTLIL